MVLARRLRLHRVLVRVVRQHEVLARHLRQRKVLVRLLRQPKVLARLPRQDWLPVAPVTPETRDLAPVSRDWVVSHETCYFLLMVFVATCGRWFVCLLFLEVARSLRHQRESDIA